jgi:hypothetical protein
MISSFYLNDAVNPGFNPDQQVSVIHSPIIREDQIPAKYLNFSFQGASFPCSSHLSAFSLYIALP